MSSPESGGIERSSAASPFKTNSSVPHAFHECGEIGHRISRNDHITVKLSSDLLRKAKHRRAPAIGECAVEAAGRTITANLCGMRTPKTRGPSWLNACGGRAGRLEVTCVLLAAPVAAEPSPVPSAIIP